MQLQVGNLPRNVTGHRAIRAMRHKHSVIISTSSCLLTGQRQKSCQTRYLINSNDQYRLLPPRVASFVTEFLFKKNLLNFLQLTGQFNSAKKRYTWPKYYVLFHPFSLDNFLVRFFLQIANLWGFFLDISSLFNIIFQRIHLIIIISVFILRIALLHIFCRTLQNEKEKCNKERGDSIKYSRTPL